MADANLPDTDKTTKPQDEEAEWRGGAKAQERGEEERSNQQGWGTPGSEAAKGESGTADTTSRPDQTDTKPDA
jgi:hypothetical protein